MAFRFGDDVSRGDAEVRVELRIGAGGTEAGHTDKAAELPKISSFQHWLFKELEAKTAF